MLGLKRVFLSRKQFDIKNVKFMRCLSNTTPKSIINNLADVNDCQSYLDYCKQKDISLISTTFKGTLYELISKLFLEQNLKCFNLNRVGGSYDDGIDIFGNWNLNHFWIDNNSTIISTSNKKTSKALSSSLLGKSIEFNGTNKVNDIQGLTKSNKRLISLQNDINILVQCKNYDKKIKANTIREISGIYHYHVKSKSEISTTFFFLTSPYPLTKQAQAQVDSSFIPIIHCKILPLEYYGNNLITCDDIYDIKSWSGDNLESIYMNQTAKKMLNGLNMELQFQLMKNVSIFK